MSQPEERRVKKVLVVNKYHFISGGAERYFLTIMESLRGKGIEAIPLSVNYARTIPTTYQKYFIEPVVVDGEAKMINQRPTWKQKIALAAQAIYSRRAAAAVKKVIREERPDLAYFLNFNNHVSPSAIDACAEAGVPVIMRMSDFNLVCSSNMYYRDGHPCTDCKKGLFHAVVHRCVHESVVKSAVSAFAIAIHRWLGIYKKVSAFVAPTLFMKRELEELGFAPEIVHQINTFSKPETPVEPDIEQPYMLFIGRFAQYKGIDTALQAFACVADTQGVIFKCMGDEGDEDADRVKALAQKLNLKGVQFLPFERDKKKIMDVVKKSLFTVLPSENYENLPNSILESFACARPVISTRLGSIPDIVKEGE